MKSTSLFIQINSCNLPYAFCEQIGKEIKDIFDEIPFEIPDSWERVRLGYIFTYAQTKKKVNAGYADKSLWQLYDILQPVHNIQQMLITVYFVVNDISGRKIAE